MGKNAISWYKIVGIICVFLFLLMVYRREARMRTNIERLEARITALEQYIQGGKIHESHTPEPNHIAPQERQTKNNRKHNPSHPSSSARATTDYPSQADTHADEPETAATETTEYTGKFKEVVKLELNTIDSATLIRVPGIGESTAKAILSYRDKLGGYYSTEQLRERLTWESAQSHLDSWCNEWFWIDEYHIQKLQINKLSFKELISHPYLDYDDVKAIVKWRERHGEVRKRADLEQLGIRDSAKLEKLLHYVEY